MFSMFNYLVLKIKFCTYFRKIKYTERKTLLTEFTRNIDKYKEDKLLYKNMIKELSKRYKVDVFKLIMICLTSILTLIGIASIPMWLSYEENLNIGLGNVATAFLGILNISVPLSMLALIIVPICKKDKFRNYSLNFINILISIIVWASAWVTVLYIIAQGLESF